MKIEIDQSGKLENTNVTTAVAFSSGKNKSIIISSREKIRLQRHFRDVGKRRIYIYFSFSAMIFLLLKGERNIEEIIIDTEYPGQSHLIKSFLMQMFDSSHRDIDKRQIRFCQIGRVSKAHKVAIDSYRSKRGDLRVKAEDIINLIGK